MGPKNDKKARKCQYFDRGFWYKDEVHPDKVCDSLNCFDYNFEGRYPNPYKVGNRCKLNIKDNCLYSHATLLLVGKIGMFSKKE